MCCKIDRLYNLPPLDPRPQEWRANPKRYAEWLWSVLDYLAHEPWESPDHACEWLAGYLSIAKVESNRAPWPPPFDLPSPFVSARTGRGIGSKCRQNWWHKARDHKQWVRDEIEWLKDLLACVGNAMQFTDWQDTLKSMLEVYLRTDCGCNPPPRPVARALRSGADLELYS